MPFSRGSVHPRDRIQSPHCRWIPYSLSYQGSPRVLEWVASPSAVGLSDPKNWTRISCTAGRFLKSTNESLFPKASSLNFTQWHSSPLKYSLSALCHAVSPPPAKILAILLTGWGEPCFSVPRILWFPCSPFSVPLRQNSEHSLRPCSGWSPFMKCSLTTVASSRPFYLKVFSALIVHPLPPSTLTHCYLLKPRVCPDGLQFCGILVPHFTFTGCSQRRSPVSPYKLTSVESLLQQ